MQHIKHLLLIFTFISLSICWWDKGHMLVSQIAWNHLTNTQRISPRDKLN